MKDTEYSCTVYNDGHAQFVTIPPIDKLCSILKEKFERQIKDNERLLEDNKKLKDEHYKDEELSRLRQENEKLKSSLYKAFVIDENEWSKVNELSKPWKNKNLGAISGGFEYRFRPTGIGTIITLVTPDGKEHIIREL